LPTVPSSLRAVGAVLCTVAVVAATLLASSSIERRAANRGYEGTQTAQALLNTMLDRDTGLRGFLETDDEAFLQPYVSGVRSFPATVAEGHVYASGSQAGMRALDEQVALAQSWQRLAGEAIAQARANGVQRQSLGAALARKRVLDAFRAANARYLTAMNTHRVALLANATTWSTWIVVALSLLLALAGLWLVRVNAARERRAAAALRSMEQERDARERESIEARCRLAEISAQTDALTELPNRRALDETFRQMLAQADSEMTPLSAVLIDLDRFKDVNDTYGHARGDEVLTVVARTLKETVRGSDFAARLGGEEFLVLLPNTDLMGAMVVAEGIARALALCSVQDVERMVTASFGVAGYPMHGTDAPTLLRSADRAMYRAKKDGRDCIRMANAAPIHSEGSVLVPADVAGLAA
jgi:diguanylate cyclase (GGDEF)-like protein